MDTWAASRASRYGQGCSTVSCVCLRTCVFTSRGWGPVSGGDRPSQGSGVRGDLRLSGRQPTPLQGTGFWSLSSTALGVHRLFIALVGATWGRRPLPRVLNGVERPPVLGHSRLVFADGPAKGFCPFCRALSFYQGSAGLLPGLRVQVLRRVPELRRFSPRATLTFSVP